MYTILYLLCMITIKLVNPNGLVTTSDVCLFLQGTVCKKDRRYQ